MNTQVQIPKGVEWSLTTSRSGGFQSDFTLVTPSMALAFLPAPLIIETLDFDTHRNLHGDG